MNHANCCLLLILILSEVMETLSSTPASLDASLSKPVRDTADKISSSRALLTSRYPSFLTDPYAHHFGTMNASRPTSSLSRIATRTRVFDCFVESSLENNYTQFISLGCGYDFRFDRLDLPSSATIYEVDQKLVIQNKLEKMKQHSIPSKHPQIKRVPSDITSPTLFKELQSKGFDPSLPTCIIAEGLLYYFSPEVARGVIRRCRSACTDKVCGMFSAVSEEAIGGMGGLFRWGSDDVSQTFIQQGWEFSTALVLGEARCGGDCFNDFLKEVRTCEERSEELMKRDFGVKCDFCNIAAADFTVISNTIHTSSFAPRFARHR